MIDLDKEKKEFHKEFGTLDSWVGWKKRAELADEESDILLCEIKELKKKLEKIESGEFVLVPKNSKTVVAIEDIVQQQVEASGIDEPIHRLDGWRILESIEESVEKDDAQQDS